MLAADPHHHVGAHPLCPGPPPHVLRRENVAQFGTSELFKAWLVVWEALGYTPVIASVNAAHFKVEGIPPLPQSRDRVVWCFLRNDIAEANGLPDLRPTCDAMCPTCGPVEGVQHWKKNPSFPVGEYGRPGGKGDYYYVCPNSRCGAHVEPVTRGIGEALDLSVRGEPFGLGYFKGKQRVTRTPYSPTAREQVAAGLEKFGGKPFIVTRRNNVKVKSLDQPIGTLTAQGGGHHYLACPTSSPSRRYTRRPARPRTKAPRPSTATTPRCPAAPGRLHVPAPPHRADLQPLAALAGGPGPAMDRHLQRHKYPGARQGTG
ncbi:hypothetical protein ACF1G5_25340 [Streptomyces coeruleorubidus]|uniref:hypothetical protein n=1 Tax=Streptomyces coeruleorubidus TaxID=116188 RepID=UPI0036F51116